MTYLFFDTETSGLPRDWKAPASDTANWPRIVQIAWVACDRHSAVLERREHIIKPVGFTIPDDASRVHGITQERAMRDGTDLAPILNDFKAAVINASVLVAHNFEFDSTIAQAEFFRAGDGNIFSTKQHHCTMKETTEVCRLPGPYGYKWPKLSELHEHVFGETFSGAHSALADTEACMKCFFRLRDQGVFPDA
jgi:DNA polymerase-3 subunit epsilon